MFRFRHLFETPLIDSSAPSAVGFESFYRVSGVFAISANLTVSRVPSLTTSTTTGGFHSTHREISQTLDQDFQLVKKSPATH